MRSLITIVLDACNVHRATTSQGDSLEALLERIRVEDEAALCELRRQHVNLMYSVAVRVLGDSMAAETVTPLSAYHYFVCSPEPAEAVLTRIATAVPLSSASP